ncbi:MAG TPA: hypothetical protein VHD38_01960 [Candidatus Paceibacterota bacterium]|jgi:hypothetical protein|nr:hypothetical protein [Candidatus Paceibacterota bacterium]
MSSNAILGWIVALVVIGGGAYLLINHSGSDSMMADDHMMASSSDAMMASTSDSMMASSSDSMMASTSANMHVEGAIMDASGQGEMMTH